MSTGRTQTKLTELTNQGFEEHFWRLENTMEAWKHCGGAKAQLQALYWYQQQLTTRKQQTDKKQRNNKQIQNNQAGVLGTKPTVLLYSADSLDNKRKKNYLQ